MNNPANDPFLLSKRHATLVLRAFLAETEAFPLEKLTSLRRFGSDLKGSAVKDVLVPMKAYKVLTTDRVAN